MYFEYKVLIVYREFTKEYIKQEISARFGDANVIVEKKPLF